MRMETHLGWAGRWRGIFQEDVELSAFWALRDEFITIIFLPRVLCGNGFFCLAVSLASIKPLINTEGGVDVEHDMRLVSFFVFLFRMFCFDRKIPMDVKASAQYFLFSSSSSLLHFIFQLNDSR